VIIGFYVLYSLTDAATGSIVMLQPSSRDRKIMGFGDEAGACNMSLITTNEHLCYAALNNKTWTSCCACYAEIGLSKAGFEVVVYLVENLTNKARGVL
jgi:hypothetical protein